MSLPPYNYGVPPPNLALPPPIPQALVSCQPPVPTQPPPPPPPPSTTTKMPPPHLYSVPPPSLSVPLPPLNQLPPPLPISLYTPPPTAPEYMPRVNDSNNSHPSYLSQPPPSHYNSIYSRKVETKTESNKSISPSYYRESLHRYANERREGSGRPSTSRDRYRYSPDRYERDYKDRMRREHRRSRSRSPVYSRHRSRSPGRRQYEYERRREYERRKYGSESRRHSYERRSPSRDYRSHSRSVYDERRYSRSVSRRSQRSRSRESYNSHRGLSPSSKHDGGLKKPLTDREKILENFRKNYCKTSEDLMKKMEQWSKEHGSDEEEEVPNMWYRSSPAELYYKPLENGAGVTQTSKLEKLCETVMKKLIERGRNARPEVDELPPLKPTKPNICKHLAANDSSSSSSSSDSEDCIDRIMLERKQKHPRRLHPEMWFNNTGELNSGPLCRCSARARREGMRHGVYAGEETFPKCIPEQSNINKLYHYRITVSPPTNFLIKAPTIIAHDEHEFLFSGFSMFSHYKLSKLPTCKVIRFNIEYKIIYVEEPPPQNFTIRELDLFEEYLFYELLELVDLDLGKATETTCSQFHFMPRFVRYLPEGGCEVLSMSEVLKYLVDESDLLISPDMLEEVHSMDHYTWQKFVDRTKGMIVTYPGKKPCSIRVDQLDRCPPATDAKNPKSTKDIKTYYPEIVHFGIRPPQLSYTGNPEYQKAWRYYVKYRHLLANMAKPSCKDRQRLAAKEARLQEMRTQSKMKRDVTVAISSEGFYRTGLLCDVVQHAMLIPVLVRHLRFHKSLSRLEQCIGHSFAQRALLQTALTHPSHRENFGTNPDHARNSLTNCGIRQPEYGDRRIHYTRKKGIVTLINIMSRFGKNSETESAIKHNERLEFLGDAVVEFLSSIHLFKMFPGLAEGGLATYRAAIVQNQHLAQLAKNIGLEQYMLYAHGSDLCRDVVMRHAMANCFEALMGALFLDGGVEVADRVFSLALWNNEPELLEVWSKDRPHPLQEQEPLGDRKYIKDFEFLQRLTEFEDSIGVHFKHIRLLARAFTDRSVGFTHLTLGSNQRLEFLGDTVLQLVVSDKLYRHFPDHHEGHLTLLRSSLVNNRTQSMVCDDLNMSAYAIYNNPKAKPTTKKHKADLLEAFLGALYIDKNLSYCQAFCNACLFPRLQEFIMNQDWNDPKSKLQQCCLTLRSMEGGEPDIPMYKVIECLGPTNTRVYTVAVYFRGIRLASARGHSIQEAEMNAAEQALNNELFPQLDHQKRVIAKSLRNKKNKRNTTSNPSEKILKRSQHKDKMPKAYRLDKQDENESSEESTAQVSEEEENVNKKSDDEENKSGDDSGLDSDPESNDKLEHVQVSSLLSDMEKKKEELIRTNEYEKLKQKCLQLDTDEETD